MGIDCHLDAYGLGDGKPVIAGDRDRESDAVLLLNPRPQESTPPYNMEKATDVVHQFQAGVAAHDHWHCDAEQFMKIACRPGRPCWPP